MPTQQVEELENLPSWYWWFRNRIDFATQLLKKTHCLRYKWLDLGCGPGGMTAELAKSLRKNKIIATNTSIYGIEGDITLSDKLMAKGITPLAINLENSTPALPNDFDLFTAFDVLEHLQNPDTLLKHIFDASSKNAVGIITVPAMPILWSKWDREMNHYRRYTRELLIQQLTAAGFEVCQCRYIFNWAFFPALIRKVILARQKQINHEFPKSGLFLNKVFYLISHVEWVFYQFGLSFGTSVIALVSKKSFTNK